MKSSLREAVLVLLPAWLIMISSVHTTITVLPKATAIMSATPDQMTEGLTKNVTLNCTFIPGAQISSVLSIIISKAGSDIGEPYTEVAQITSQSQNVTPHDFLGGRVTGRIVTTEQSYLAFEWTNPAKEITGKYKCSVFGMDNVGHPMVSQATSEIQQKPINFELVLAKLQELEKSQIVQNNIIQEQGKLINEQKAQLNVLNSRLNNSMSAIMAANSSYGGHTYYLSRKMWRNYANDDSTCRLLGGYLLIIDDVHEFNFIKQFLAHAPSAPASVLTGVNEGGHTGTWTAFHSGERVHYLNWAPQQPDKTSGYTCVYLVKTYGWKMSDGPCLRSDWEEFVCEVPT